MVRRLSVCTCILILNRSTIPSLKRVNGFGFCGEGCGTWDKRLSKRRRETAEFEPLISFHKLLRNLRSIFQFWRRGAAEFLLVCIWLISHGLANDLCNTNKYILGRKYGLFRVLGPCLGGLGEVPRGLRGSSAWAPGSSAWAPGSSGGCGKFRVGSEKLRVGSRKFRVGSGKFREFSPETPCLVREVPDGFPGEPKGRNLAPRSAKADIFSIFVPLAKASGNSGEDFFCSTSSS